MIAGFTTHPLYLIKVCRQLQREAVASPALAFVMDRRHGARAVNVAQPGPFGIGLNVARSEGVQALYSGVSTTLLRQALYSSTRMGFYECLKHQWRDEAEEGSGPPLYNKVTAALVAGGSGAIMGNPADLAMVKMQADDRLPIYERRNYTGVGNGLSRMVKQDGVLSLWTGLTPTVTRAVLVTVAQLATYDQIKGAIIMNHMVPEGLATQVVASCGAGVLASVASNPIDVV